MNETLNDKIKEIGSIFGITEFPDNIGEIVESFISTENIQPDNISNIDDSKPKDKNENLINEEKYVQIMNRLNQSNFNIKNNKKIQLLYAIEPFLNNKRKDKVSNCIKFITFADLAKDLNIF